MKLDTLLVLGLSLLVGCQSPSISTARAVIGPSNGSTVSGVITLSQSGKSLHIAGRISGLSPNSQHGFHIHEFGDISSPDGSSAGGHYNPHHRDHGDHPHDHHVGDLGNLETDASGTVVLDMVLDSVSLSGRYGVIGRSFIIHAEDDDLRSQPSGAAGPRIGMGVIGIAK